MSGNAVKRDAVTRLLLGKIADGTLRPGAPVPSGAALARETGYAPVTCLAALRGVRALLRLHEQYQAAAVRAAPAAGRAEAARAAPAPPPLPASVSIGPGGVTVTWPGGTTTVARPPGWRD